MIANFYTGMLQKFLNKKKILSTLLQNTCIVVTLGHCNKLGWFLPIVLIVLNKHLACSIFQGLLSNITSLIVMPPYRRALWQI